jgi:2,3,4,5-tetrahydropyridine-2,6-dicarboxylate N-succinyltransferase
MRDLRDVIDELWARRESLIATDPDITRPILEAVQQLDNGTARVAEIVDDQVVVHEWLKRAILLFFATTPNVASAVGPIRDSGQGAVKDGA